MPSRSTATNYRLVNQVRANVVQVASTLEQASYGPTVTNLGIAGDYNLDHYAGTYLVDDFYSI